MYLTQAVKLYNVLITGSECWLCALRETQPTWSKRKILSSEWESFVCSTCSHSGIKTMHRSWLFYSIILLHSITFTGLALLSSITKANQRRFHSHHVGLSVLITWPCPLHGVGSSKFWNPITHRAKKALQLTPADSLLRWQHLAGASVCVCVCMCVCVPVHLSVCLTSELAALSFCWLS